MTVPFFIIGGPPGAGKSTIAPILAEKLGLEFFEGDALVSDEDKAVLSSGVPLSKAVALRWKLDLIKAAHDLETRSLALKGIVTSYLALTKEGRALLRSEIKKLNNCGSNLKLIIVWCSINKDESIRRAETRKGHHYNPVISDWLFPRIETPCCEGPEKEENIYLVDANQKVEDVVADTLKIMDQCITQIT